MKKVDLGSQGLRVPAIGLGCMGMSDFYGSCSEAENLHVLERAADLGCTFWDTSDMYGPFTNEILLSKALKGRRDRITLATKFGVSRGQDGSWQGIKGNADYVKASCDASLQRLGTDRIDLYYQHRLDPETPIEETVAAMAGLVKAGKVRFIGLSEADPGTIARAHAIHPVSALQTEYSLWSRDVEADILPVIRRLGVGFVAYAPLGRSRISPSTQESRARSKRSAGTRPSPSPACRNSTLANPAAAALALAFSSMRGCMSTASTRPCGPTAAAMGTASRPGPQPASSTLIPGASSSSPRTVVARRLATGLSTSQARKAGQGNARFLDRARPPNHTKSASRTRIAKMTMGFIFSG